MYDGRAWLINVNGNVSYSDDEHPDKVEISFDFIETGDLNSSSDMKNAAAVEGGVHNGRTLTAADVAAISGCTEEELALSGFLMVCNYYDRPRTAPGLQSAIAFSFKKIRRLYPLHLIMMAAALLFVLKGLLAQPSARGVLSCAAQLAVSIGKSCH